MEIVIGGDRISKLLCSITKGLEVLKRINFRELDRAIYDTMSRQRQFPKEL